ncbi:M6 family metalloprotease domain-containing protein [Bisporella sp. PMI_857]|nr:M6 family metalloprotease domain-containing protein [Bisporella sp. PMI_857]
MAVIRLSHPGTGSRLGTALLIASILSVSQASTDPFTILDQQNWVNPDNMTWAEYLHPPGTSWSDPSVSGSVRNFNIALVTVDYTDKPFVVTQPPESTIYKNPQPGWESIRREDVPAYYRNFLNTPNELNQGHTLHEYWMGDSFGRFGVNLTAFGPYLLPALSYQYGIDTTGFNVGGCPSGPPCNRNIRTDALGAWRAAVGNNIADSFELAFILSAGQDESSTWQEFGEMKFQTKESVPAEFGPPSSLNSTNSTNWARTRYVEWSSWAAASNIWPNAGGGSSTQAESSGMSTYAHELSHLIGIGDNYNNPYGVPLRRAYTGPFSMLDRGTFNGPGGPHSRWKIPALEGSSMGSLHTVRDKTQLGLIGPESVLELSREALPSSGLVLAKITARSVDPGTSRIIGLHISISADLSPSCTIATDVLCDGGGYNSYHVEVVDRMGADSFVPDHGVMISKTKIDDVQPFQWVIDANPQDINLIDFYRPNGSAAHITMGDYRQLSDALFHAGTRSGSEYEFVDEANSLHFFVVDIERDEDGILSYEVGVTAVNGGSSSVHGVSLSSGNPSGNATGLGTTCSFTLTNNGTYIPASVNTPQHPANLTTYLDSDIYRLSATILEPGWQVEIVNALKAAKFGESVEVEVAVKTEEGAESPGIVVLNVVSVSDSNVVAAARCEVNL